MRKKTLRLPACLVLGCLASVSCSQMTEQSYRTDGAPAGIHELESLFVLATAPQSRDVRKPVRDERARAMRLLAEKTQAYLDMTDGWDCEARLISVTINEARRACARRDIQAFRQALEGLGAAARESDLARVRSEYSEVMGIYHHMRQCIGEIHS